MNLRPRAVLLVVALVTLATPRRSEARGSAAFADTAWQSCGVPLSNGPNDPAGLLGVSDGAGGAFLVWQQLLPLSSSNDLYGQHVDAFGAIVPGWNAAGSALCAALGGQTDNVAIPDGAGGLLVAWTDGRLDLSGSGNSDIFALRVDANGARHSGWNADGNALTGSTLGQFYPAIASDDLDGAFVAWQQPVASGSADGQIVVQHVTATGSIATGWPANGVVIATGTGPRGDATVVADDAGGCIVAWDDGRGTDADLYAQRVTSAGAALWTAGGELICAGAHDQVTPHGIRDGLGGMLLVMLEIDNGDFASLDIVGQHVDGNGARVSGWPLAGLGLCRASGAQFGHSIAPDAANGAFVCWEDYRSAQARVYVQHVTSAGGIVAGFDPAGNRVTDGIGDENEATLVADGSGGALVAWSENTSAIGLQRVTSAGTPAAGWNAGGVKLCADHIQYSPALAEDGLHGAVVGYLDQRASPIQVYGSHVTFDAQVGTRLALAAVEARPERVRLTWFGASAVGTSFDLWRQRGSEPWIKVATLGADGSGFVRFDDAEVRAGDRLTYRLTALGQLDPLADDVVVEVPTSSSAAPRLVPNPAPGLLAVRFSLPRAEEVRWELLDVSGRRVAAGDFGRLEAGEHHEALAGTAALAAGIYALRVTSPSGTTTTRGCVVR